MEDKRLFHRYPAGVRVAFRVSGEGFRGKITDVSAGGGFVATDALPPIGSRLQMAAQTSRDDPSVWLDVRVTWVNEEPSGSHPNPGFGGYWLHASCRYGEATLRSFLSQVLGITRAVVRPMTPPAGGEAIYVYKFPDVYERHDEDLPWSEPRNLKDAGKATRVRRVGAAAARAPSKRESKAREGTKPSAQQASAQAAHAGAAQAAGAKPAAFSQATLAMLDAIPDLSGAAHAPPPEDSGLEVLARLTQAEPLTVEHSSPSLPGPVDGPAETGDPSGGRWGFLVRKLSGIRSRGSNGAAPAVTFQGGFTVRYKMGRTWVDARVHKIERSYLVIEAGGDAPEVWSRLLLQIPTEGRMSRAIEVHATVTRVKEAEDGSAVELVHCKINRVDEKGIPGAFGSYLDAFRAERG